MRRGRRDRNARFAQRNNPEPLLQRDSRLGPTFARFVEHPRDLCHRHFVVGRVFDAGDVTVIADGAQKDAGASALGALYHPQERFDGDRIARKRIHQPPESGGRSATSSPSFTRVSSFTWRRFNAASGRGGRLRAPGTVSRTRSSTSFTVAAAGTATAAVSQPVSSA